MILDGIKGAFLALSDSINILNEPFLPNIREPIIVDKKSLAQKAEIYFSDIQSNFLYGSNKEFYWHHDPNDLGDMAIWQGFYTAMCAMRGQQSTLIRALRGMEVIQYISGKSRVGRGADSRPFSYNKDPNHKYYSYGKYDFRADPSESSMIGHIYGLWACLQDDQADTVKDMAKKFICDLAEQLMRDNYKMINPDGSTAKFGNLTPGIFTAPIRIASVCAVLALAHYATGQSEFKANYENITNRYSETLKHLETHFLWINPAYDEFLAYAVLTVLLKSIPIDSKANSVYYIALNNMWDKTHMQGNSFYTFTYQLLTHKARQAELQQAVDTLMEFNTDPSAGPLTKGSPRSNDINPPGVEFDSWGWGKKKKRISKTPIPIIYREPHDFIWQRSPYEIDKQSTHAVNGMDFCLAYWLGQKSGALNGSEPREETR